MQPEPPTLDQIPESDLLPAEWWIIFFTLVSISSIITYGFQEKANRWFEKGLVGRKASMWAEIAAIPVCCFLGWFSIYQSDITFMKPWVGLLAGFLGSMASPWFLSLIGRLINRKLGKEVPKKTDTSEENDDPPKYGG